MNERTVFVNRTGIMEYVPCNFCGCDDSKLLYRKRGRTIPETFHIVRCRKCGLAYVNPRLKKDISIGLYNDDYYDGKGIDNSFNGANRKKQRDAIILARCLKESIPRRSGGLNLLDVGGGEGLVSEAAKKLGFDALVCDISETAVHRAKQKGLECYKGELLDDFFNEYIGLFDVIVALEVIEHVYDPKAFLARVCGLLKPGGVFIYTTGNFQETRFLGGRWGYMDIPESHIYFFTPDMIHKYLIGAGFSGFLDPYRYYTKANFGVRVLSKLGLLDINRHTCPGSLLEKALYSYGFKCAEWLLGRTRLPFAVK